MLHAIELGTNIKEFCFWGQILYRFIFTYNTIAMQFIVFKFVAESPILKNVMSPTDKQHYNALFSIFRTRPRMSG